MDTSFPDRVQYFWLVYSLTLQISLLTFSAYKFDSFKDFSGWIDKES